MSWLVKYLKVLGNILNLFLYNYIKMDCSIFEIGNVQFFQ